MTAALQLQPTAPIEADTTVRTIHLFLNDEVAPFEFGKGHDMWVVIGLKARALNVTGARILVDRLHQIEVIIFSAAAYSRPAYYKTAHLARSHHRARCDDEAADQTSVEAECASPSHG